MIQESYRPVVRKWSPTPRQAEILRINKPTIDWLWKLTAVEMAPYAGQWIAARECRIIASAATRAEIESQIADLDRATVIVHKIENRWMIR